MLNDIQQAEDVVTQPDGERVLRRLTDLFNFLFHKPNRFHE